MASCECGREWMGMSEAHCAACHESFSTVTNFDDHRVFDVDADWNTRRCLTPAEMDDLHSKTGRKRFDRSGRAGGYQVWISAGGGNPHAEARNATR